MDQGCDFLPSHIGVGASLCKRRTATYRILRHVDQGHAMSGIIVEGEFQLLIHLPLANTALLGFELEEEQEVRPKHSQIRPSTLSVERFRLELKFPVKIRIPLRKGLLKQRA